MLQKIEEAAKNFCIHQIRLDYTVTQGAHTQEQLHIAYIDIDTQEKKQYRIYFASEQKFLQKVAELFLEEQESDEETLQDMLLETINLIVGSAKVLASDDDSAQQFTIQTPHFLEYGSLTFAYDEAFTLSVEDTMLCIAIKELNA